ncbi:cyclin-dependent protein kinase inhibitor SMR11-like [Mangifera indica]|uniref:cyclin-dependent protein kinase inhibitor SMR11-like n=1 Tax=Mangifera indica TaxID=29780 RepID=UPI001CFAE4E1|nr:cyclin-dependent protein kinase inhibitor SMR11-like [Mangifera indica]XP_044472899.1 cyclin-dependent protein kinase inhibitor SMR11-like [Mangifera indica]
MDSVNCVFLSDQCQGCEKLDDACNGEAVEVSAMSNGSASLEPITPVPDREIADSPYDCKTPLTEAKRSTKVPCFGAKTARQDNPVASVDDSSPCAKTSRKEEPDTCADDSSPRTPNDVVFDPFAPGPDNMAMAPLCKKYLYQMRTSVARRLKFESSFNMMEDNTCVNDAESISDEEMFESVYNNLLEAIVSKQTEGLLAEISNTEWDSNYCKTPPGHRLNGIAKTCPGAPMKPPAKSRNIDLGLCRKLKF